MPLLVNLKVSVSGADRHHRLKNLFTWKMNLKFQNFYWWKFERESGENRKSINGIAYTYNNSYLHKCSSTVRCNYSYVHNRNYVYTCTYKILPIYKEFKLYESLASVFISFAFAFNLFLSLTIHSVQSLPPQRTVTNSSNKEILMSVTQSFLVTIFRSKIAQRFWRRSRFNLHLQRTKRFLLWSMTINIIGGVLNFSAMLFVLSSC